MYILAILCLYDLCILKFCCCCKNSTSRIYNTRIIILTTAAVDNRQWIQKTMIYWQWWILLFNNKTKLNYCYHRQLHGPHGSILLARSILSSLLPHPTLKHITTKNKINIHYNAIMITVQTYGCTAIYSHFVLTSRLVCKLCVCVWLCTRGRSGVVMFWRKFRFIAIPGPHTTKLNLQPSFLL